METQQTDKYVLRKTFQTPYQQHKQHAGKTFTFLGKNKKHSPNDVEEIETYSILLMDNITIEALPEEIFVGLGWEPKNSIIKDA